MTITATTHTSRTADQFDEALRRLDDELDALELDEPIEVHAIGGYALLKHGVHRGDRSVTADINTLTHPYSSRIRQLIRRVGEGLALEWDWLGNDIVFDDPGVIEDMIGAEWVSINIGTRNIDVSIASIASLTRAKIIATNDSVYSGRDQDELDLIGLLAHQGIRTIAQFRDAYPDECEEYPIAHCLVEHRFASQNGDTRRVHRLDTELAGLAPADDGFDDIWDDDLWRPDDDAA